MAKQPEFLYAILILPVLFALILIFEGIDKFMKRESGWFSLTLGLIFLGIVIGVYFGFLYK